MKNFFTKATSTTLHTKRKWIFVGNEQDSQKAAEQWTIPPLLAQILLNRGLSPNEPAEAFLAPQLADLYPPDTLPGAVHAAELIVNAIENDKKIVIYGDYDVDGVTGISILWHMLSSAGAQVGFYVPHRLDEGYGLNQEALDGLIDEGADLIVSVDCGITSLEIAEAVCKRNIPLIITDHHQPQDRIPSATEVVHPALGGTYANPHLCGAGVAFKLAWAIAQKLSNNTRVDAKFRDLLVDLLPLAALGTIADVVPLSGENRIIAKHGLRNLSDARLLGLRALISSAGLTNSNVDSTDVGFRIAPRINAVGRMGHARLAVELLTTADESRANEIAIYLEDHNRSRQSKDRSITKQACKIIDDNNLASDSRRAIVLASSEWHAGVIGIVASRIVDRYSRPAIVITMKDGQGQGSGRSIKPFHLCEALQECSEHLISHGGHAMAAGLRVEEDKVEEFTEAFVSVANNRLCGDDLIPRLRLDAEVNLDELTLTTTNAIQNLEPFGAGNPRPMLASKWLDLAAEPRLVGKDQKHIQASFSQGNTRLKGIAFGLGAAIEDLKQHRRCQVAFEPIINDFNGRRTVEMRIVDFSFPAA